MKVFLRSAAAVVISLFIGTNIFAGTPSEQQAQDGSILWKFKTNGAIHASALVENDVIYIGSLDSSFYAIDASKGTELWHFKAKDRIYTTAVKNENVVCFESGNVLYGLNLDGTLKWQFELYNGDVIYQNDEWDYFHSSPYLFNGTVYIGSEKGLVYGVDITSGAKTYQCQTPAAKSTIETTPIIYNNKIYVGDWDGVFYAFNLSDGSLAWKYDTKENGTFSWVSAIVTDPVVYKGEIFFAGRSCRLYCMDPETGTKKWLYKDKQDMWIVGGPTIIDDVVYTGSSYQHVIRTVNAVTGELIRDAGATYRVNGKPLIDGDCVFVGTEDDSDVNLGTFEVHDKATGKAKAKINIGAWVHSSPILKKGIIYFGATNGNMYAVDKEKLLNTPYPDTYMTCLNTIDLGTLQNVGTYDTTLYVCNKGMGEDSVNVSTFLSQVKVEPTIFKIAPHDSQVVKLSINLEGMRARKYFGQINVTSIKGVSIRLITRNIIFTVENAVDVESGNNLPKEYSLSQNYPNPFNPRTLIEFELPTSSNVSLKVYDVIGKEIATLISEYMPAGKYSTYFPSFQSSQLYSKLSSGIYFYTLMAGDFIQSKKMLLIK